ncbi:MAG: helix-turn-helix transcriptional regulator [Ruminococcus sp.]|nr:helix-turn-helix transcriptional regulator [Ruminococcus sp.]
MNIDAIGCNHKHSGSFLIDRPEGIGDWLLLLVKSPAVFVVGHENIHAVSGSFIIYTPGIPEYYYAETDLYINDWLHFTPDEEDIQLIHRLRIPLNTPIFAYNSKQLASVLKYMMYEFYSGNRYNTETIERCFEMLMFKLAEACSERPDQGKTELFMENAVQTDQRNMLSGRLFEIRQLIHTYPGREWRAADMAEELMISVSYFQHSYKRIFGISVNQDVMKARAEKAAELLENDHGLTVKYIGKFVGYRSDSYFSRHFKSVYGVTPAEYRRQRCK